MNHNIPIFISHAWDYSDHYTKLAEWIFKNNWNVQKVPITFTDTSIPRHDPVHTNGTDYQLKAIIEDRIYQTSVVVIPTGVYASHSKWIKKEIEAAQLMSKPILAVNIWGSQRSSTVVADASDQLVGWNKQSVVSGIWQLSRTSN